MGIQRGNFAGAVFWAAIWKNHGAMVAKANLCLENAWVKSSHEIFGWNHLVIKQKPEVGKFHKLHWLVMLFGICKLIKVWMSWFLCLSAHFFTISTRICCPARPPFFELAKWLDPHCTSSFTHFHNLTQHLSRNKRADRVAMQCIQRLCSVLMYRCFGQFPSSCMNEDTEHYQIHHWTSSLKQDETGALCIIWLIEPLSSRIHVIFPIASGFGRGGDSCSRTSSKDELAKLWKIRKVFGRSLTPLAGKGTLVAASGSASAPAQLEIVVALWKSCC